MSNLEKVDPADQIDLTNGILGDIRDLIPMITDNGDTKMVVDGLSLGTVEWFLGDPNGTEFALRLKFVKSRMRNLGIHYGETSPVQKANHSFTLCSEDTPSGFLLHVEVGRGKSSSQVALDIYDDVRTASRSHDVDDPFEVSVSKLEVFRQHTPYIQNRVRAETYDELRRLLVGVRIYIHEPSGFSGDTLTFIRR